MCRRRSAAHLLHVVIEQKCESLPALYTLLPHRFHFSFLSLLPSPSGSPSLITSTIFSPPVAGQQAGRASLGDVKTTGRACSEIYHADVPWKNQSLSVDKNIFFLLSLCFSMMENVRGSGKRCQRNVWSICEALTNTLHLFLHTTV